MVETPERSYAPEQVVPRRTSATPRRKLRRDFDEDFDSDFEDRFDGMDETQEFGGTAGLG